MDPCIYPHLARESEIPVDVTRRKKLHKHLKYHPKNGGQESGEAAAQILFQVHPPQVSSEVSQFAVSAANCRYCAAASHPKAGSRKGEQ